jgi:3-hydroxyisobutyrate dehydrogenase-like beta-hydroxyacid dehydrogenase
MLREYARGAAGGEKAHMTFLINCLMALAAGRVEPAAAGKMQLVLKDLGIACDLASNGGRAAEVTRLVESLFRVLQG